MKNSYEDIRNAIAEEPKWFDENGVPRYCEFAPHHCANIYASECCLLHIACQGCEQDFDVAMSFYIHNTIHNGGEALSDMIEHKTIGYGDPPNIDCCPAGPTMSSDTIRVIEFWRREGPDGWRRKPEFEIDVNDE